MPVVPVVVVVPVVPLVVCVLETSPVLPPVEPEPEPEPEPVAPDTDPPPPIGTAVETSDELLEWLVPPQPITTAARRTRRTGMILARRREEVDTIRCYPVKRFLCVVPRLFPVERTPRGAA